MVASRDDSAVGLRLVLSFWSFLCCLRLFVLLPDTDACVVVALLLLPPLLLLWLN